MGWLMSDIPSSGECVMVFTQDQLREALAHYKKHESEYADTEAIEDFFASDSAGKLYVQKFRYRYDRTTNTHNEGETS